MLSVPSLNTGTVICIITRLSTIGFFQVLAVTFVMQRDVDFLHFPSNSPRVFLDRHVLLVSSYIFPTQMSLDLPRQVLSTSLFQTIEISHE